MFGIVLGGTLYSKVHGTSNAKQTKNLTYRHRSGSESSVLSSSFLIKSEVKRTEVKAVYLGVETSSDTTKNNADTRKLAIPRNVENEKYILAKTETSTRVKQCQLISVSCSKRDACFSLLNDAKNRIVFDDVLLATGSHLLPGTLNSQPVAVLL